MSYTRTYALKGRQPPGWMHIAPINPLSEKQWAVVEAAVRLTGLGSHRYVTVDSAAVLGRTSKATARTALQKLCDMGILRRQGQCPVMYKRRVYRP